MFCNEVKEKCNTKRLRCLPIEGENPKATNFIEYIFLVRRGRERKREEK